MRCPAVRANNSKTVSLMVQGCGGGNSSHTLTFLHGAVRLTISVISLPCELAYPNPETDVWFWSRPKGGLLALVAQLELCSCRRSQSANGYSVPNSFVRRRKEYLSGTVFTAYVQHSRFESNKGLCGSNSESISTGVWPSLVS